MSANNNLILNAAFAGAMAGAIGGSLPIAADDADYAEVIATASIIAQKVDQEIPFDAQLSVSSSSPVAIAPTTATIQAGQLAKTGLIRELVYSATLGRMQAGFSEDFTSLAAAVAAIYIAAEADLVIP